MVLTTAEPRVGTLHAPRPAPVVLAPRPARGSHVRLHHLQTGPDGESQEPLAHISGDLAHRHAHLLRHGERTRVERLGLIQLVTAVPRIPSGKLVRPSADERDQLLAGQLRRRRHPVITAHPSRSTIDTPTSQEPHKK
jgi:hypothetical protein